MSAGRGVAAGPVGGRRWAGVLLAVEAVALLVVVAGGRDPALRPVTAAFGGDSRHLIAHVDVGVALGVVVALLAVGRFVPRRLGPWIDPLLTWPIVVFVVALLNGVEDVGALVGIYALASGGVLFGMVQGRGPRHALGFGSAVGIVPWGIVAFQQVGAMIVDSPVGGGVVLVTLVALAVAVAEFAAVWRGAGAAALWLRVVGLSVVAWVVVLS